MTANVDPNHAIPRQQWIFGRIRGMNKALLGRFLLTGMERFPTGGPSEPISLLLHASPQSIRFQGVALEDSFALPEFLVESALQSLLAST